jgi:hypothetical protein
MEDAPFRRSACPAGDRCCWPASTADEERFATALWAVHREATRSAVAMSFAGIVYQTEDRDARALARKIEPLAQFFHDAEMQVRTMSTPPSLSTTHGQYVDAMALYAKFLRSGVLGQHQIKWPVVAS